MQAEELHRKATEQLKACGVESAALDSRLIICHGLGITLEEFVANPQREICENELETIRVLLEKRKTRLPVSKLIGTREFYGLNFKVTLAVLDPRPDSETLVEAVLKKYTDKNAPLKVLDLGTGSGCLMLSILKNLPQAGGVGVDMSSSALKVAEENAGLLELSDRAILKQSNWLENISGEFDVILSNPPYILEEEIAGLAPEVREHDPKMALSGGADGLDCYRTIIPAAQKHLSQNGMIIFECGAGQSRQIGAMLSDAGYADIAYHKDLAGIERCISAHKALPHG